MNLHNDIMNIPAKPEVDYEEDAHCSDELQMDFEIWYKNGHRDARHAAAELALGAESKLHTLLNAMIDLTQSEDVETARRARSALFDIDLICGNDGGVKECLELYNNRSL